MELKYNKAEMCAKVKLTHFWFLLFCHLTSLDVHLTYSNVPDPKHNWHYFNYLVHIRSTITHINLAGSFIITT